MSHVFFIFWSVKPFYTILVCKKRRISTSYTSNIVLSSILPSTGEKRSNSPQNRSNGIGIRIKRQKKLFPVFIQFLIQEKLSLHSLSHTTVFNQVTTDSKITISNRHRTLLFSGLQLPFKLQKCRHWMPMTAHGANTQSCRNQEHTHTMAVESQDNKSHFLTCLVNLSHPSARISGNDGSNIQRFAFGLIRPSVRPPR